MLLSKSPFVFLALFLVLSGCSPKKAESVNEKNRIDYTVVQAFPHDVSAFTEGLIVHQGKLYESTGQDDSWIAEVDITSGTQNKKVVLDRKYFGEGITILNNKVYQLTWQTNLGFVYEYPSFKKIKEFNFPHEGWGITHDNSKLIVSDGTDKLYFLDTVSLRQTGSINVREDGISQGKLNELEFIDGYVYANQWQTNYILKIDPSSGDVIGRMDLSSLADRAHAVNPGAEVLNGIAYEKKSKLMLVTGKNWPALFALRLKTDTVKTR